MKTHLIPQTTRAINRPFTATRASALCGMAALALCLGLSMTPIAHAAAATPPGSSQTSMSNPPGTVGSSGMRSHQDYGATGMAPCNCNNSDTMGQSGTTSGDSESSQAGMEGNSKNPAHRRCEDNGTMARSGTQSGSASGQPCDRTDTNSGSNATGNSTPGSADSDSSTSALGNGMANKADRHSGAGENSNGNQ